MRACNVGKIMYNKCCGWRGRLAQLVEHHVDIVRSLVQAQYRPPATGFLWCALRFLFKPTDLHWELGVHVPSTSGPHLCGIAERQTEHPPATEAGCKQGGGRHCGTLFGKAELCNGSTYDSDSYCLGSNPSSAATWLLGQAV